MNSKVVYFIKSNAGKLLRVVNHAQLGGGYLTYLFGPTGWYIEAISNEEFVTQCFGVWATALQQVKVKS